MATSLAEQLQRLTVPQTSVLRESKKKASLLFDPKEAASLRRETVYHIGLEGLEDLILKNAVFKQFKNSLFHVTSKNFDRSVQTKEGNQRVDKIIKKFLLLLSPYFMVSSSHKALEWLINRYAINEYNRKELLMLVLPYHETNIFVRVIQTMQFKDQNDSFYFLKQLQKPGVHLPKQSLLHHAASNVGFLKFVTKLISSLLKVHENPHLLTVPFNFYCFIFAGAIEYSAQVTENQVSQILPLILKGLNSPIPDFAAASYVITARLVTKTTLSDKLLNKFMEKLSNGQCKNFKVEVTLVSLVIYQSQKQYEDMSSTAVAKFSEIEWLPQCLQYLNSNGNYIYPFLRVLVKRASEEGLNEKFKACRDLVISLLNEIKLDEFFIDEFLCLILDVLDLKMEYSKEVFEWLCNIIQILDTQYPSNFDKAVHNVMNSSSLDFNYKRNSCLKKIIENVATYKGKLEIFNKLYHPSEELRQESLNYISENFTNLKQSEQAFITNSLLYRLNDDSPKIVRKTLNLLLKTNIVPQQLYEIVLINLLKNEKMLSNEWKGIFVSIINVLIKGRDFDWKILLAVFPFLVQSSKKKMKEVKSILNSSFFTNYELFASFCQEIDTIQDHNQLFNSFLVCFEKNNDIRVVEYLLTFINSDSEISIVSHYCAIFVLSLLLPEKCCLRISSNVLQVLEDFYRKFQHDISKDKLNLERSVAICFKSIFPLEGWKECIKKIINKTDQLESNIDFSKELEISVWLKSVCVLLFNAHVTKDFSDNCLKHVYPESYSKLNFLLNISASGILTEPCSIKVLSFTRYILQNDKHFERITNINSFTISCLFCLLINPVSTIRKYALDIMNSILQNSVKNFEDNFYLLEGMIAHAEEIFVDNEQPALLMYNLLTSLSTKTKKDVDDDCLSDLIKLACDNSAPTYIRAGILTVLSHINDFGIFENLCSNMLNFNEDIGVIDGHYATIYERLINRLDSLVVPKIALTSNIWKFVENTLQSKKEINTGSEQTSLSALLLNQLTREVHCGISNTVFEKLINVVCEVLINNQHPEVLSVANRFFKHMDLDAKLIINILEKMRDVQSSKVDLTKKRRRMNIAPTVDILDNVEWKKGVSVLELIQNKKKIRNGDCLLPVLFGILKKCLDFEEQDAVEYPKQLLLSLILLICSKVEQRSIPEKLFNVELVIQCIRASQNPQTHHHALLVLINAAQLVPADVLHHIMTIFTFMGSSLLRYDDAYSFQIITKIIDTIIPILLKENHVTSTANVLRVFVDALLDIPEHRRIPLYKQLLNKVDEKENLSLFLLLAFEGQVLHGSPEKQKQVKGMESRRLDILTNICLEFSPEIVLHSCLQLIKYLKQLPDEKDDAVEVNIELGIFNIKNYSAKQFRHYKYLIMTFMKNLLTSQQFVNKVFILTNIQSCNLESLYKDLIINILTYIQRIQKVTQRASNTPQAQYWKIMLHHSYDILDSVNALLTSRMFLLVIKGLLMHNIYTVKRRALELLNAKLQHNFQYFDDCDVNEMYNLVPPIILTIESLNTKCLDGDQEILIQTALLSLKLLVKALAPQDPEKFVKILEFVTNLLNSIKAQNNVLASVILCLAELCANLRVHAISCLPEVMPAFLKILKNQKHQETSNLLLLSVVTAVYKLLDSLPLFLSPYLKKIIFEISILISKWDCVTNDQKLIPLINKFSSIRQKIGTLIPARILIPTIENSYNSLVDKRYFKAVGPLMDILAECFKHWSSTDVSANMKELNNFFLQALKFRSEKNVSIEEANLVEGYIVKALTVLTLKLSEGSFRPFYYKIYDWAVRSAEKSERLITFYNLSMNIAQSLKGLFVLFVSHFFNNAVQIITDINKLKSKSYFKDDTKDILLLEFVLKTLQIVFSYDSQKFVNRERFDLLMQPLVDQLENDMDGIEVLVKRNERLLTPTIVHFSLAVADDVCWKQINYQILLKMRSQSPDVRLIALHCLKEVVVKLGQDFLPLLPETIPFLAELLEDEEEKVEKACQKAIHEMENVLGEPLQKYF